MPARGWTAVEQISVPLSPFTRRSGSLPLRHADTTLRRRLAAGEHLVLHDPTTGEHLTAVVVEAAPDGPDHCEDQAQDPALACYRLRIGTRITEAEAAARVASEADEGWLSTGDIVGLLAAAHRTQRQMAAALAEMGMS